MRPPIRSRRGSSARRSSSPTRPALREALAGADTLYNTYWVRFAHGETTFERAVANTRMLVRAAAGRGRPPRRPAQRDERLGRTRRSRTSAARRRSSEAVRSSGLAYAIVRPTLIFGPRDILVNNIAWGLRRTPVFPVAGDGRYRVQPVSVEDTATICVDAARPAEDVVVDAAGPETLTLRGARAARRPPRSEAAPASCTRPPRLVLGLGARSSDWRGATSC